MKTILSSATFMALCTAASAAQAEPLQCMLPVAGDALPLSVIVGQLEAKGYRDIRKIDRKGGCYKIKAHVEAGRVELYAKRSDGTLVRGAKGE